MKKKIFVTGGHFTPAKAVVDVLLREGEWEIYYIGRKHALEGDSALSLEYQEMTRLPNVTFLSLIAGKVPRRFTTKAIVSVLKIPVGLLQSLYLLLYYRPRVIMSFGGYVAVPIVTIGTILGIPVAHHEQIPAFDFPSKFLAFLADKVMVSFPHLLPQKDTTKWSYTGNPIREEVKIVQDVPALTVLKSQKAHGKKTVLYITGGNQGSHVVNAVVLKLLPTLLKDYLVIWQTGDSQQFHDYDQATEVIAACPLELQKRIVVQKFVLGDAIGAVFALSDIVIGRSGANTVFELAMLAKPAVLIPIPWVHDQEQLKNAQLLASAGAAEIISQNDLSEETLLKSIQKIGATYVQYRKAAEKVKASLPSDPAAQIVATLTKLAS